MRKLTFFLFLLVFGVGLLVGNSVNIKLIYSKEPEKVQVTYTFDNCVSEFSEKTAEKTAKGYRHWFVPKSLSGHLNLKLSQVQEKSANHPPHTHEEAEIFYILKGQAEFNLNGQTRVVSENTSLYCPSQVPHGIRNVGDTPLRYLVIKNN